MSFQGCGRCLCRCRRPRGLRRLDLEQAAAVQDNTLQRYRKAVLKFAVWLGDNFPDIEDAADFDEALVEYKQGHAVSKAEFEAMVSSLEFRFPHFKGGLCASRAVIKGWSVSHHPRHTVPMGRGPARLFAVHMVALAVPFLGIALLLQRERA